MRSRVLALTTGVALLGTLAVLPAAAVDRPSHAQLAIMTLPRESFGSAETQRFDVDIGSGFSDNATAAEGTLDPKDTGRQLARAGRIDGYDLSYSDQSLLPLVRGSGLLSVDSSVDLFDSRAAADAFVTKQLRDALRLRGKLVDGLRLRSSGTFSPATVGDRSIGLRMTTMVGDKPVYGTLVGFRVGTLVGAVEIDRADAQPAAAMAQQLARSLASRMRLAASGRLNAQPVAVPPVGRSGQRPPGVDLAAMALSKQDLPKRTILVRQGYVNDRTSIGSYEREFDTSSASFGAQIVESDVSLYRRASEAAGAFRIFRAVFTSSTLERDLADEWDEPNLVVEQRGPLSIGHESSVLVFRFPAMGLVPTRVAIIQVRVGRTVGTLTVAGIAQTFRSVDAKPLGETLAQRMRDGL